MTKRFFILILLSYFCTVQAQELIHPLTLPANRVSEMPISDVFFSQTYNDVQFESHPNLQVKFDTSTQTLAIQPTAGTEGWQLLSFTQRGSRQDIPVQISGKPSYTFRYKDATKPKQVSVFGQFNGWDRSVNPLLDPDGDGTFETTVSMDVGSYEYKFSVDGREELDPFNPEKVANPFGSFNSFLVVKPIHPEKINLRLLDYREESISVPPYLKTLFFRVHVETDLPNDGKPYQAFVLLDNVAHNKIQIIQEGSNFRGFTVPMELVENGAHTLRFMLSKNGVASPMQTVYLHNGKARGVQANEPFIWNDAILYSLMIDRFRNGDKSNDNPIVADSLWEAANYQGGDFAGLRQVLDEGYFQKLGANVLWISPVNKNPNTAHREFPQPKNWYTAYHGYWPISDTDVEEHFGTMSEFKKLVKDYQEKGKMKVLMDFVAHHVHEAHPNFLSKPHWFGQLDLPDGRKNIRLWDDYRLTTWFDTFLPTYDFEKNPDAVDYLSDNAVWWLKETGIDGYRHDAVKHVPNLFWRSVTQKIKTQVNPTRSAPVYQIGETFGGYDLIKSYINPGQLDAQFNFNLFYRARYVFLDPKASFQLLDDELQNGFNSYGLHHLMGNLMDSHDQVRYMAFADGDLTLDGQDHGTRAFVNQPDVTHPESYKKVALYMAYLMTTPGIPIIYHGDEIGMTGAADPDNRRFMKWQNEWNSNERALFEAVSKLTQIRAQNSALRYGDFQSLAANGELYAFIRSDFNQKVLVVFNKDANPQQLSLRFPDYYNVKSATDLLVNRKMPIAARGEFNVVIPAGGYAVYVLE